MSPSPRWLAACGALLAAAAVALSAYAAHGVDADAQGRLQTAAILAFGHGIALAALAPHAAHRLGRIALTGLLIGTLLFAGALVAAHGFGTATRLAPIGGGLLLLSWLAWAVDALRR